MAKTFRQRKSLRNAYVFCLAVFLLFALGFAYGMWIDVRPAWRVQATVCALVFWGPWAGFCVWALLAHKKETLTITDEQIVFEGVIRRKEIDLASIKEAIWRIDNHGSLILKTLTDKLTIRFDNYEVEDRLWMIRHLQSHIPPAVQHRWDMFCLKLAVPLQEATLHPNPPPKPDEITITRRRWDWYFLPAIFFAAIFGVVAWWRFQQPRILFAPLGFIVLWLWLHFQTPEKGFVSKRLSAQPEFVSSLYFLGIWCLVGIAGIALFPFLPLQPPVSYGVGTLAFVIYFSVVLMRAYKEDQRRILRESEAIPVALQKWKENNDLIH